MELDAAFISYTNIITGYINMLEECLSSITSNMKECTGMISRLECAVNEPYQLRKIRGSYFMDTDGRKPTFFTRSEHEGEWKMMPIHTKWTREEESVLVDAVSEEATRQYNRVLLDMMKHIDMSPIRVLEEKVKQENERVRKQEMERIRRETGKVSSNPLNVESVPTAPAATADDSDRLEIVPDENVMESLRRYENEYGEVSVISEEDNKAVMDEWSKNMTYVNKYCHLLTTDEYNKCLNTISTMTYAYKEMVSNAYRRKDIDLSKEQWRTIAKEVGRHTGLDCMLHYEQLSRRDFTQSVLDTVGKSAEVQQFIERIDQYNSDEDKEQLDELRNDMIVFAEQHQIAYVSLLRFIQQKRVSRRTTSAFSKEEDERLIDAVAQNEKGDWKAVAFDVKGRTAQQCLHRYEKSLMATKKGHWTNEERKKALVCYKLFPNQWKKISTFFPDRIDTQIRDYLTNSLAVGVTKREPWTQDEDQLIVQCCHTDDYLNPKTQRPRWSKIAAMLKGRTDCQCRKRYDIMGQTVRRLGLDPTQENYLKVAEMVRKSSTHGQKEGERSSQEAAPEAVRSTSPLGISPDTKCDRSKKPQKE